jgi:hypothetical protein
MAPRLGEKYGIEVEIISRLREAYKSEEYARLGLPAAPAIMIGEEIIVQGKDISEEELETAIRRHLAQFGQDAKKNCGLFSGG